MQEESDSGDQRHQTRDKEPEYGTRSPRVLQTIELGLEGGKKTLETVDALVEVLALVPPSMRSGRRGFRTDELRDGRRHRDRRSDDLRMSSRESAKEHRNFSISSTTVSSSLMDWTARNRGRG